MMNAATARNLTLDEAITALDLALAYPLTDEARGILVAKLIDAADDVCESQYQIELVESELEAVYELAECKEFAPKQGGEKASK